MYLSALRQAVNVKLIHVVFSENITDFKDQVTTAVIANLAQWSNIILYFTGSGQKYTN